MASTPPSPRVAFIGLGVMGFPMAAHLATAGYRVKVYNRTRATAQRWLDTHPGPHEAAASPALAASDCDFVFMCVGNDDDVRAVTLGEDGVLAGMQVGGQPATAKILVDHTTASRELAIELAEAAASSGIGFLDAPVSGGQAGAENGALTVMVGGAEEHFARALDVINSYAKKCVLLGPVGSGQLTKMVNQICIAGILQGLSEGIHFAQRAQLDVGAVVDVIAQGAAQSWQMNNRAGTMDKDEFEFGFAVDWMRKDLDIALRTARGLQAKLPVTALVDQFYADIQDMGGGRWDTSSLLRRLTR